MREGMRIEGEGKDVRDVNCWRMFEGGVGALGRD